MIERKNVYIRPEDVVELVLQLCKKRQTIEELREDLTKINYYLKHEKFNKLQEEFDL